MKGKHILLGITGSIAAYKAAILVRALVREGAEVRVVMTPLAKEFITPLTLATLSKHPILVDFFDPENGAWNSHVSLGEWADVYLIAPATANTLGKMVHGIADNLLLTSYLSAKCPVAAAPAMDLDMYAHPATQENLDTLRARGVRIIEPESGELASGLTGKGRMAEPETIVEYLHNMLSANKFWSEKRVLVTAGATLEPIDPVRYISNHSTGRMGCAVAVELARRGAEVVLVKGRTTVAAPCNPRIREVEAPTAAEMYRVCNEEFPSCDAAVMAAAVADYTPAQVSERKIKKNPDEWQLELTKTRDIAASLGARKEGRLLVGFALETDNGPENAAEKMRRKNFDLIVLNSPGADTGFGTETNRVTILHADGARIDYPLRPKTEVAADIVDRMECQASGH
jgi:phosphopantothenoylcysteine decarboxylase/phosphopantothenate--cysteine ligase